MNDSLLEYKLDLVATHLGVYKIEEVAAVIRRQFTRTDGERAETIDFYPPWNAQGTFGKLKICHEYMDSDWQRQRFEKYAGVKIADLPIYEAQQALRRQFSRPSPHEVAVQPFRLMVQPQRNDEGEDGKTLILRYLSSPKAQQGQLPPAQPAAANGQEQPTNGNGRAQPQSPPPSPQSPAAVSPAEWLNRARQATDPFDFDTCLQRGLVIGGSAYFETADHAEKARTGLFGEWNGAAGAYLAGIEKYVKMRADLLAAGEPGAAVFKKAKSAAMVAYRETLERAAA